MSTKLCSIGLLTLAGLCSASASLATDYTDPHQRARDMIVAPPAIHETNAAGAQGRRIESRGYDDPHTRAAHLLSHDSPKFASAPVSTGGMQQTGYSDPQQRAQEIILGKPH